MRSPQIGRNHANTGSRLETNFNLFRSLVAAIDDANVVWNGLQRLEVVSVTLDQIVTNRNWYSNQ